AEPHGLGDLAHRRTAVAVARDDLERDGEDFLALRDSLCVRTPSGHPSIIQTERCLYFKTERRMVFQTDPSTRWSLNARHLRPHPRREGRPDERPRLLAPQGDRT